MGLFEQPVTVDVGHQQTSNKKIENVLVSEISMDETLPIDIDDDDDEEMMAETAAAVELKKKQKKR